MSGWMPRLPRWLLLLLPFLDHLVTLFHGASLLLNLFPHGTPSLAFLFVSLILLCLLLSLTSPLPRGWLHPCLFLPLPSLLSLGLLLNFIFCLGEVPLLLSLHLLGRHCHLSPSWSSSSLLPSHLTALSRSWPFFPFLSPVLTSSE